MNTLQNSVREYFPDCPETILYEGPQSTNRLAFKHYNATEVVAGKTMAEHLRFAVCYWHTFRGMGGDPFGAATMVRAWEQAGDPMQRAQDTMDAAFEFMGRLGIQFWAFHDRDIAPEGASLAESTRR